MVSLEVYNPNCTSCRCASAPWTGRSLRAQASDGRRSSALRCYTRRPSLRAKTDPHYPQSQTVIVGFRSPRLVHAEPPVTITRLAGERAARTWCRVRHRPSWRATRTRRSVWDVLSGPSLLGAREPCSGYLLPRPRAHSEPTVVYFLVASGGRRELPIATCHSLRGDRATAVGPR
jgi:hypothetical protein